MAATIEIGVIGLGKFGMTLARSLAELGHKVVGVDADPDAVRRAKEDLDQVYEADATQSSTLEQLRFQDFDYVVVSIGQSMEASILITLNLLDIEAKKIWVKATSAPHSKVLSRLGVDYVILPEHYVAQQLANRIVTPGFLDFLPMGQGVLLREIEVEKWDGKTLRELNLPANHNVQVVAIKDKDGRDYRFVPRADHPMQAGQKLVVLGAPEDVHKLAD